MRFEEQFGGMRGRLTYTVYKNGVPIETFDEDNLIVDGSKVTLARLLGGDVTNRPITQIQFGTNGTAPAAGNTTITSPFSKSIDSVSYPATNQVQFNFTLGSAEANGKAILEFGLLNAIGTLVARRIRASALNKDTDISLSGSWLITF